MAKTPGVYFNLYRTPDEVWRSVLKFQTHQHGDAISVSGCCMGSWFDAVKKTTSKARSLLRDPRTVAALTAVAPLMPGGIPALAALQVVSAVSAAGKKGALQKLAPKLEDKTLRQLAQGVAKIADGKATSLSGGPILLAEPDRATRALMGALRDAEDNERAEVLARARAALKWGEAHAKTPEGRELVARAREQYRQLKAGQS